MARVPYLDKDDLAPENQDLLSRTISLNRALVNSPEACRATARQAEKTGDSDACFSTDFCGFRCVRRATAEEIQRMKK